MRVALGLRAGLWRQMSFRIRILSFINWNTHFGGQWFISLSSLVLLKMTNGGKLHWNFVLDLCSLDGDSLLSSGMGTWHKPQTRSPQSPGHRLAAVSNLLGTGPHSRRWVAGEWASKASSIFTALSHSNSYQVSSGIINVMLLNHHEAFLSALLSHPFPPAIYGKTVFQETSSCCQKRLGTTALDCQSIPCPWSQWLVQGWARSSEKQRNCCWKFWKRLLLKLNLEGCGAGLPQLPCHREGKRANTVVTQWESTGWPYGERGEPWIKMYMKLVYLFSFQHTTQYIFSLLMPISATFKEKSLNWYALKTWTNYFISLRLFYVKMGINLPTHRIIMKSFKMMYVKYLIQILVLKIKCLINFSY